MGFAVKITTFLELLDLICPYNCRGCGRIGTPLCECCKNYNIHRQSNFCPNCFAPTEYLCAECDLPFSAVFACGWRDELLGQLVEEYKFNAARAFSRTLAEVLAEKIPVLLGEIQIVPLPTITRHIRQRGFDHTLRLARDLGRLRHWPVTSLLQRAQNTVQVGTGREERVAQAGQAYCLNSQYPVDPTKTYLLLDDVWTTGASMFAAADLLKRAGAQNLLATVLVVSGQHG